MSILVILTSICIAMPAAGSSAILPRADCSPNRLYVVAANDTCQIIAQSQNVSTNDIIALNCLNPLCTNLPANSTIRLPGCCDTYTVKEGDNCASIASPIRNLTLANFYLFNPTIHQDCSNLDFGNNVCLTPPQGTQFSPPNCSTQTSSSSASAATPTPSLASGTNSICLPLYTVQAGDNCITVASKNSIPASHFQQLNPSINSECSNLHPGQEYCVSPP